MESCLLCGVIVACVRLPILAHIPGHAPKNVFYMCRSPAAGRVSKLASCGLLANSKGAQRNGRMSWVESLCSVTAVRDLGNLGS